MGSLGITATMWGPKIAKLVISWFIIPSNYGYYGYLPSINHSEIVVINQLNAILRAPHCRDSMGFPWDFHGISMTPWDSPDFIEFSREYDGHHMGI